MRSILITGVSSGIGRACANRFSAAGWSVTGTVRDTALRPVELDEGVVLARLDLAHAGGATALAEELLAKDACPDVVLNNAGMVMFGPIEETSDDDFAHIFQVNVFGQLELIRALLPTMRERGSGTIVNVTSLGGTMTFPFFGVYNSTKWTLEGISEGLWHELKPFGIRVKVIEPGFVETAVWDKALPGRTDTGERSRAVSTTGAYDRFLQSMVAFEGSITNRTTAEAAAVQIERAINDDSDRLRYPVAAYARPIIAARRWMGSQFMMRFFHDRWMGR